MNVYKLFSAVPDLLLATYDDHYTLVETNIDHVPSFLHLFQQLHYLDHIYEYGSKQDTPYMLSTYMGMVWLAVYEKKDGELYRVHVLGPVFFNPYSDASMEQFLRKYEEKGMAFSAKHRLIAEMKQIPVIRYSQFAYYGIMLHYCINEQIISLNDIHHMDDDSQLPTDSESLSDEPDNDYDDMDALYQNIWRMETLQTEEVASGQMGSQQDQIYNLYIKGATGSIPTTHTRIAEPMRIRKDSLLILNAIECRAAISAGVLPQIAYRTEEQFIAEIENNHSPTGMNSLQIQFYNAYCHLVKEAKEDTKQYSLPVRNYISFIQNNLTSSVTPEQITELTGYSTYYLNRIFKLEVGISPKQFQRNLRIHHSATLLKTTHDPIVKIAEQMQYSSYSHFCKDFKTVMGCTPADYREANESI